MTKTYYPAIDETVYRQTLSCGLRVAVVPRKGFTKKLAYLVTDFGSIHTDFEYEGQRHRVPAGVAHYLEHKLFDMPGGRDVSEEFAALGAMTNAFTSYDMTAYYFSTTEHFEECLGLLVEFVTTPYFTEESVEKERGIIDQEIGMNEDAPDSVIFDALTAGMFRKHPIRIPILGTRESIREITPEVLHLVHRAFYAPGNLLLCVIGDVEPERVCTLAREVLGDVPREVGIKCRAWEEQPGCQTPEIRKSMEVAMPCFSLGFKCPAPSFGEEGVLEEFTADIAAEVLFGESSRLYEELYQQGKIDSSFGGGFETIDGCAMLLCSGDSREPEKVRDAIIARAGELAKSGIDDETILRIKRSALGRRIRGLDSFDGTCFRLCAYDLTGYDYFRFPEIYRELSKDRVIRFLEELSDPSRWAISIIYPNCKEETP